jgi:hypothetical protein
MNRPIIISLLLITALQAASAVAFSNESEQATVPSLSYIWSVSGIENGQVIMVLSQDGSDLYGQAKYEPDDGQAWNAIVIGSVEEDKIYLVLTALKDTVQFSSRLKGTYDAASGSIKGDILQVSNGNFSLRSQFQALWINPDISSYTSVREEPQAKASAFRQETNTSLPDAIESLLPESSQKSRYHDVREDADRILTGVGDISQIPIGMSGL